MWKIKFNKFSFYFENKQVDSFHIWAMLPRKCAGKIVNIRMLLVCFKGFWKKKIFGWNSIDTEWWDQRKELLFKVKTTINRFKSKIDLNGNQNQIGKFISNIGSFPFDSFLFFLGYIGIKFVNGKTSLFLIYSICFFLCRILGKIQISEVFKVYSH